MNKAKAQVFFPNLNGLRFFCFISVFFFHSFATKYTDVLADPVYTLVKYRLFLNGNLGVNFFFVLSGFLITYLLLVEKSATQRVHIKKFYLRRVLRIWPLFYLCVFFGFIIFPILKKLSGATPNETANPIYYLVFLNNFDFIRKGVPDSSVLSVLWSVAIEEQFYLAWPLIIGFSKPRLLPLIFVIILAGSFTFRLLNANSEIILEHHTLSCISDLTIGGLAAYLSFYSTRFINLIRNLPRNFLIAIYLCTLAVFLFRGEIFHHGSFMLAIDRLIVSLLFIFIILEQNFCNNSLFKIGSFKRISKLGEYTYGLYCLHMIGILVAFTLLSKLGLNKSVWEILIVEGGLSLGIAILLAYLSYQLFEKKFLDLKYRFELINTKPDSQKEKFKEK
jgi:peptidoglycan/LPS O-acetylase OafA/YrhL